MRVGRRGLLAMVNVSCSGVLGTQFDVGVVGLTQRLVALRAEIDSILAELDHSNSINALNGSDAVAPSVTEPSAALNHDVRTGKIFDQTAFDTICGIDVIGTGSAEFSSEPAGEHCHRTAGIARFWGHRTNRPAFFLRRGLPSKVLARTTKAPTRPMT